MGFCNQERWIIWKYVDGHAKEGDEISFHMFRNLHEKY
jgi:hypothetical protein